MGNNYCSCLEIRDNNYELPTNRVNTDPNKFLPKTASNSSANRTYSAPLFTPEQMPLLCRLQARARGNLFRKHAKSHKMSVINKQRMISSTFDTNYSFTDKEVIVKENFI